MAIRREASEFEKRTTRSKHVSSNGGMANLNMPRVGTLTLYTVVVTEH